MATPSPIVVSVSGKTVAEVRDALIALGNALGGEAIQHVELAEDAVEAKVHVKNNTGAKAKAKAEPEPQPEPQPADTEEAQPAPADNHVSDLSPADALKQGIDQMQAFFMEKPDRMPMLTKLRDQFGVTKFADIPDARAHDFLAEVKLIVSGAAHA